MVHHGIHLRCPGCPKDQAEAACEEQKSTFFLNQKATNWKKTCTWCLIPNQIAFWFLFQQKDVVILEMCFFYFFWNVAIWDIFLQKKKLPGHHPEAVSHLCFGRSQAEPFSWAMKKKSGYIRDETLPSYVGPSYVGIIINHYKDPYEKNV